MKLHKTIIVKSKSADFLNTVSMIPKRISEIKATSAEPITAPDRFAVNVVAKALHPQKLSLRIRRIEEHSADVKSYYLTWENNVPTPHFRAGQYLTVQLKVGPSLLTRPYSLASSPSSALHGEYHIMVKRVPDGFASGYILDNWKVGERVTAFAPEGNFVYEPLRDAKTVVGLAGGSGITPFLSFARAIADGTEDFNLTLLYGARTKDEIVFKAELDRIAKTCDKVKVVYVLSDAKNVGAGYEKGFIGADLIKKYAPENEPYSVFVCGPGAMYRFLGQELPKLGIADKYIRMEMSAGARKLADEPGYPTELLDKTFCLTVIDRGETTQIECKAEDSILCALEKAGIAVPARCRSGECGFCRSKLVSGEIFIPQGVDKRRMADVEFGYIHPCCTYPLSDITLKIN